MYTHALPAFQVHTSTEEFMKKWNDVHDLATLRAEIRRQRDFAVHQVGQPPATSHGQLP